MSKKMTHTIEIERRDGWYGMKPAGKVKCRLLKNHIVLEKGEKYKKDDGEKVNAHRYKGVYMENTKVCPETLWPIEE